MYQNTISREEIELELDVAIGSPKQSARAKSKLEKMALTKEESSKRSFKNGFIFGVVVTTTIFFVLNLIY